MLEFSLSEKVKDTYRKRNRRITSIYSGAGISDIFSDDLRAPPAEASSKNLE